MRLVSSSQVSPTCRLDLVPTEFPSSLCEFNMDKRLKLCQHGEKGFDRGKNKISLFFVEYPDFPLLGVGRFVNINYHTLDSL